MSFCTLGNDKTPILVFTPYIQQQLYDEIIKFIDCLSQIYQCNLSTNKFLHTLYTATMQWNFQIFHSQIYLQVSQKSFHKKLNKNIQWKNLLRQRPLPSPLPSSPGKGREGQGENKMNKQWNYLHIQRNCQVLTVKLMGDPGKRRWVH